MSEKIMESAQFTSEPELSFCTSKIELKSALNFVNAALGLKNINPMLQNILFEVKNSSLRLFATDLKVAIQYSTFATEVEGEGRFLLPGKHFMEIINSCFSSQDEVSFEIFENKSLKLTLGSGVYNIPGMSDEQYPEKPEIVTTFEFSLPLDLLKEAIKSTIFSVAIDDTKQSMRGILFKFSSPNLEVVSTDSRRLSYIKIKIDSNCPDNLSLLIPPKILSEILKLDGKEDINIIVGTGNIQFTYKNITFWSNLINAKFPNYEAVIPDEFKIKIKVDKSIFINSIKSILPIARVASNTIRLSLKENKLALLAESSTFGSARQTLDVENPENFEIEIAFNARYLMDPLDLFEKTIVLELNSPDKQGKISSPEKAGYFYIIMPIRL